MILIRTIRGKSFHEDEVGSQLVEFALTCTILFAMIFGIFTCCLVLYADHFVAYAAREGARYMMVRGSSWSANCSAKATANCTAQSTDVTTFIKNMTPAGITANKLQIQVGAPMTALQAKCSNSNESNSPDCQPSATPQPTCNSGGASHDPGCVVTVTVSYPFNFNIPLVLPKTLTLSSTSAAIIAQ